MTTIEDYETSKQVMSKDIMTKLGVYKRPRTTDENDVNSSNQPDAKKSRSNSPETEADKVRVNIAAINIDEDPTGWYRPRGYYYPYHVLRATMFHDYCVTQHTIGVASGRERIERWLETNEELKIDTTLMDTFSVPNPDDDNELIDTAWTNDEEEYEESRQYQVYKIDNHKDYDFHAEEYIAASDGCMCPDEEEKYVLYYSEPCHELPEDFTLDDVDNTTNWVSPVAEAW